MKNPNPWFSLRGPLMFIHDEVKDSRSIKYSFKCHYHFVKLKQETDFMWVWFY